MRQSFWKFSQSFYGGLIFNKQNAYEDWYDINVGERYIYAYKSDIWIIYAMKRYNCLYFYVCSTFICSNNKIKNYINFINLTANISLLKKSI